jgi:hypothetical protein
MFFVSTFYTCRVTERGMRDNLRLILVPLVAGISMLIVTWAVRALLFVHLPTPVLLCVEIAAAAVAFLGAVHVLGPTVLGDARALLSELLRPEKTADTGAGMAS